MAPGSLCFIAFLFCPALLVPLPDAIPPRMTFTTSLFLGKATSFHVRCGLLIWPGPHTAGSQSIGGAEDPAAVLRQAQEIPVALVECPLLYHLENLSVVDFALALCPGESRPGPYLQPVLEATFPQSWTGPGLRCIGRTLLHWIHFSTWCLWLRCCRLLLFIVHPNVSKGDTCKAVYAKVMMRFNEIDHHFGVDSLARVTFADIWMDERIAQKRSFGGMPLTKSRLKQSQVTRQVLDPDLVCFLNLFSRCFRHPGCCLLFQELLGKDLPQASADRSQKPLTSTAVRSASIFICSLRTLTSCKLTVN